MRLLPLLLLCASLTGCRLPGKPSADHTPPRPQAVLSFEPLYRQNCQACHGVDGRNGMAVSLASPAYIAYAGRDRIADVTANGIGGSLMPAFATHAGGLLTDQQIGVLADGIVSRWSRTQDLAGAIPPPYDSTAIGAPVSGEQLYRADCLHCHAPGPASVLSPTYLALVSNGGLRTLLVVGKPEAGMPDWRGYPGGALTDQQLADLVSFAESHRTAAPSQPYPDAPGASKGAAPGTTSKPDNAPAQQRPPASPGPATANQHPTTTPHNPRATKTMSTRP